MASEYWDKMRKRRVGRRRVLATGAMGAAGAALAATVGCGDDDDDGGTPAAGGGSPSGGGQGSAAFPEARTSPKLIAAITFDTPVSLDFHTHDSPGGHWAAQPAYNGLMYRIEDPPGTFSHLAPELVESWEQPAGRHDRPQGARGREVAGHRPAERARLYRRGREVQPRAHPGRTSGSESDSGRVPHARHVLAHRPDGGAGEHHNAAHLAAVRAAAEQPVILVGADDSPRDGGVERRSQRPAMGGRHRPVDIWTGTTPSPTAAHSGTYAIRRTGSRGSPSSTSSTFPSSSPPKRYRRSFSRTSSIRASPSTRHRRCR